MSRGLIASLVVKRERWSLTWRGRLAAAALLGVMAAAGAVSLYPFLAITSRVPGSVLVIDGWMPTYDLERASLEFSSGGYERALVVRGVYDLDSIGLDRPWDDYVADILVREGIPRERLTSVLFPGLKKDRTFTSALAVKQWFHRRGITVTAVTIATAGPHARRSRLLYQKAFGSDVAVGVVGLDEPSFDTVHWWRSSEGMREVLFEGLAYAYVRLFYFPDSDASVVILTNRP